MKISHVLLCLALVFASRASAWADDAPALPPATPVPDQQTLEKQFEETMSGATLAGSFTVDGRQDDQPLKQEKYTITKVSKLKGDFWLFQSRIQYGNHDTTLALPLEVRWAGDTPVITLTNYTVPGFGNFTCRILVYKDHYCGTWRGADHGGQMFGRVLHQETARND